MSAGFTPGPTYESEGPQCPYCGRQYTADEPHYFDEQNYIEETCDTCGRTFDVEVLRTVDWACEPRGEAPDPGPPPGPPDPPKPPAWRVA